MTMLQLAKARKRISELLLSVPVRIKISGIIVLPVLLLALALNYWIRTGLSDWLSYLLDDERVATAMQAGSRSVFVVSIVVAAIAIQLTFILMYILTQPLLELRQTALEVKNGKLATRARVWADDEIGDVAKAVNRMIDQLVSGQVELARANQHLAAMNRIAMAAVRDLNVQEVLKASLTEMLAVTGLESGWAYLRVQGTEQFELVSYSNLKAARLGVDSLQNREPLCACQQDLLKGNLHDAIIVQQCQRMAGAGSAPGKQYHITIPLRSRGQPLGVINLLCPEHAQPKQDDLELLGSIGVQVSEIAANAWLYSSLLEKEAMRQSLSNALMQAQESERSHLARELHDGPGQTLTSLLMRLKALQKKIKLKGVRADLDDSCQLVSDIIVQVREISYLLRPAALEELGLTVAVQALAQRIGQASGFQVDFDNRMGEKKLPPEVEIALYRIVQEGLTNVVQHAKASHVNIQLILYNQDVYLQIRDDGIGFDPEQAHALDDRRHLGLVSMQERAGILGGTVSICSAPSSGTAIEVHIPFVQEQLNGQEIGPDSIGR